MWICYTGLLFYFGGGGILLQLIVSYTQRVLAFSKVWIVYSVCVEGDNRPLRGLLMTHTMPNLAQSCAIAAPPAHHPHPRHRLLQ
jgi:hypothetical protein